jgi:hypothetical protein
MGDLSPEQEQILTQLREWVLANNLNQEGRFDDYDYLRFCRARKFVLADVQLMFYNHVTWRQKELINGLHLEWDFPERALVQDIYPRGYHGLDK